MTENMTRLFSNTSKMVSRIDNYNHQIEIYNNIIFWLILSCAAMLIGVAIYFYMKRRLRQ